MPLVSVDTSTRASAESLRSSTRRQDWLWGIMLVQRSPYGSCGSFDFFLLKYVNELSSFFAEYRGHLAGLMIWSNEFDGKISSDWWTNPSELVRQSEGIDGKKSWQVWGKPIRLLLVCFYVSGY